MEAVYLTLFVSALLAALGVGLFVGTHRAGTREHLDRLALLPLDDDCVVAAPAPNSTKATEP